MVDPSKLQREREREITVAGLTGNAGDIHIVNIDENTE